MTLSFGQRVLSLFFGLLRQSNLFLDSGDYSSSPDKQLSREKVIVSEGNSVQLVVAWTKTIRRQENTFYIRLPLLTESRPLCPSAAVRKLLHVIGPQPPKAQAFPIKGEHFNKRLKTLTAATTGNYSSHSFSRGGGGEGGKQLGPSHAGYLVRLSKSWVIGPVHVTYDIWTKYLPM